MAVTIEGYSVVVPQDRIRPLLEQKAVEIPNRTALGDPDVWRCCFMDESDAMNFIRSLEKLGLNASQGPDPDVVLVSEFDCSIHPYCEWLLTARWEKAVIAWKAGTRPESVFAKEGWDPKTGSGLSFADSSSQQHLEFLRLEGNIEVYLNKKTGKEMYVGRTSAPAEALFKTASQVVLKYLVTAGERPLTGKAANEVATAVEMLEKVTAAAPDFWNAHWFLGKGQLALGNLERAYRSFRRAFDLERNVETVPRELAGVCLELRRFNEAISVAEQAVAIAPKNAGLIGNLALAYLLAGRIQEAQKSISAAIKIDQEDTINKHLRQVITEVAEGRRPQPESLASLTAIPARPKKKFWEFWK
jgi:tetratricopeptide (TPR) repeat protein